MKGCGRRRRGRPAGGRRRAGAKCSGGPGGAATVMLAQKGAVPPSLARGVALAATPGGCGAAGRQGGRPLNRRSGVLTEVWGRAWMRRRARPRFLAGGRGAATSVRPVGAWRGALREGRLRRDGRWTWHGGLRTRTQGAGARRGRGSGLWASRTPGGAILASGKRYVLAVFAVPPGRRGHPARARPAAGAVVGVASRPGAGGRSMSCGIVVFSRRGG